MSPKESTCFSAFRRAAFLVLLSLFLWQAVSSLFKFSQGRTTITTETLQAKTQPFPTVSICPYPKTKKEEVGLYLESEQSFQEEINLSNPDFWVYYEQVEENGLISRSDLDSLGKWTSVVSMDTFSGLLVNCFSFSQNKTLPTGYNTTLYLAFHSNSSNMGIFLHDDPKAVLVANSMHGTQFFIINRLTMGAMSRFAMYTIMSTKMEVRPKKEIPCYESKEDAMENNFYNCFEHAIEKNISCTLPWRAKENSRRICQTSLGFKRWYDAYKDAGEQEMYEATGCYRSCKFTSYYANKFVEEITDEPIVPEATHNYLIGLYLASGSVDHAKEVLVFDLMDLIGNVGGFLGLFLGASIMTVFDEAKNAWDWFKRTR